MTFPSRSTQRLASPWYPKHELTVNLLSYSSPFLGHVHSLTFSIPAILEQQYLLWLREW